MVSRDYMLKKPAPPGMLHLWLDQQAIPATANLLAVGERVLERVAAPTRRHPRAGVALAILAGFLAALSLAPRRAARRGSGSRSARRRSRSG